jgi:hypothetical protein
MSGSTKELRLRSDTRPDGSTGPAPGCGSGTGAIAAFTSPSRRRALTSQRARRTRDGQDHDRVSVRHRLRAAADHQAAAPAPEGVPRPRRRVEAACLGDADHRRDHQGRHPDRSDGHRADARRLGERGQLEGDRPARRGRPLADGQEPLDPDDRGSTWEADRDADRDVDPGRGPAEDGGGEAPERAPWIRR